MEPHQVQALFTQPDGSYRFARWGRPIVPVVFGVDDATLAVVKGAVEAVVALARHHIAETDPELGANLMVFFVRDWADLPVVPKLDQLVPGLAALCERLQAAKANQYRLFRFDEAGAIKAVFVFLRMGGDLAEVPAQDLALNEAALMICTWAEGAFCSTSALARVGDTAVLRADIAEVIRASYDRMLPDMAQDPAHAFRISARMRVDLTKCG